MKHSNTNVMRGEIPPSMINFVPNDSQQGALKAMKHWYDFERDYKPYFTLSGAAGTGKTSLILYFFQMMGFGMNDFICAAYVGKAVTVLASKGLPAKTIHSLIYRRTIVYERDEKGELVLDEEGKPKEKLQFILKDKLDYPYQIIAIDEASMVDTNLEADLLSFGVPIIFIGDHHQLPPIFGTSAVMMNPDYILTQIMRQEKDNPIIYLSQMVIRGIPLEVGTYGDSKITDSVDLGTNLLTDYDTIVVGRNKVRQMFNDHIRYRLLQAKDYYPMEGEKLICRQNNWDQDLGSGFYLTNGTQGIMDHIYYDKMKKGCVPIDFVPDITKRKVGKLKMDTEYIKLKCYETNTYGLSKYNKFEYAYAITAHLSQGSEWPSVLFLDGKFQDYDTTQKLRYTAITRASQRIHIVIKGRKL